MFLFGEEQRPNFLQIDSILVFTTSYEYISDYELSANSIMFPMNTSTSTQQQIRNHQPLFSRSFC